MRIVRPILLATVLLAPATLTFAQGAPPTKAAPTATASAKASAAPTASVKASAAPTASIAPPAGPGASASHEISTEVDAAMNEKAQALYKEANAFFKDAKYAQAHVNYKAAWALDVRSQRIVRNLGSTELELKMYRDAAEHLTIALRLADPNDPKRPSIQKDIAEARAKVGTLQLAITGTGQPLDGVEIVHMETGRTYTTPLTDPIFVDAGKSSFRIRREGYESQEKVFDLKPGEETTTEIPLERAPGFDGRTGPGVPTGSATTTAPGGERSKVPGFVIGGVGVVAAIAGAALVGVAAGVPGEIDAQLPKENGTSLCRRNAQPGEPAICPDLRAKAESGDTMGNAGIGLLIGGGVLVAGAAVYLLLPSRKANSGSSRVIPVVGQNGGGLVFTGSF